jgi:hypothetical protein
MRTLRGHQRQNDRIVATPFGTDRDAQTGKAAADHQHIGVNDFHVADS